MTRLGFVAWQELVRPWKLLSLALGVSLLVLGSYWTPAMDWDIPISLIMALFTYLTASRGLESLLGRQWRSLPVAIFWAWFSVDGCYALYWQVRAPEVLLAMREANFLPSLCLYGICGGIWLYKGNIRSLCRDVKAAWHKQTHP